MARQHSIAKTNQSGSFMDLLDDHAGRSGSESDKPLNRDTFLESFWGNLLEIGRSPLPYAISATTFLHFEISFSPLSILISLTPIAIVMSSTAGHGLLDSKWAVPAI
ncbi:hypothetical protein V8E54_003956 [Elaphomyces granulatus]